MQQQQRPRDRVAQMQQMSGTREFQQQGGSGDQPQPMGEGSYEGTREYRERIDRYLKDADVQKDAERAKPQSVEEAGKLEQAERDAQSHSKGEK